MVVLPRLRTWPFAGLVLLLTLGISSGQLVQLVSPLRWSSDAYSYDSATSAVHTRSVIADTAAAAERAGAATTPRGQARGRR